MESRTRKEHYRLLMSTSAFLQTRFANRRPTPLMEVKANMIFCLPSTLVLSTRKICWKSSFAMSDYKHPQNNPKSHHIRSRLLHGNQTRNFLFKLIPNGRSRECPKNRKNSSNRTHQMGQLLRAGLRRNSLQQRNQRHCSRWDRKIQSSHPQKKTYLWKRKKNRWKRREQGLTIVATCCCSFVRRRAENARCGRRANFVQSVKKKAMAAPNPKSQPGNPSVKGVQNASFLRLIWLCMFGRETLTRV